MEEQFRPIVEHIFNNWTALQLAVEHSMGGPNSKNLALDFVDEITKYCVEEINNVDVGDIQEELEGVMDEWFDTLCEDNSPAEIANLLFRFLRLLKSGNVEQCEVEYKNLPTCKLWLSKPQPQPSAAPEAASSSDMEADAAITSMADVPMDEESQWTEVKSRRRK